VGRQNPPAPSGVWPGHRAPRFGATRVAGLSRRPSFSILLPMHQSLAAREFVSVAFPSSSTVCRLSAANTAEPFYSQASGQSVVSVAGTKRVRASQRMRSAPFCHLPFGQRPLQSQSVRCSAFSVQRSAFSDWPVGFLATRHRRPASRSCQAISPGIPKASSRARRSSDTASAISPEMPSKFPRRINPPS
jgi:hypothetical protein